MKDFVSQSSLFHEIGRLEIINDTLKSVLHMSWNEFAFFSLTLYSKQGPFLCPSAIPLPYCSSLFFLRSLCNILLEFFYLLSHNLRDGRLILDRIVVHPYPAHLNNAYHAEKEVYSGQATRYNKVDILISKEERQKR